MGVAPLQSPWGSVELTSQAGWPLTPLSWLHPVVTIILDMILIQPCVHATWSGAASRAPRSPLSMSSSLHLPSKLCSRTVLPIPGVDTNGRRTESSRYTDDEPGSLSWRARHWPLYPRNASIFAMCSVRLLWVEGRVSEWTGAGERERLLAPGLTELGPTQV